MQPSLTFSRRYKGVDYDLGAIEEVTKLCLPNNQLVGATQAVSVLKPEHCLLAKKTVHHLQRTLLGGESVQRNVNRLICLVSHGKMAMTESATPNILLSLIHI